jgi:hypothetical protein
LEILTSLCKCLIKSLTRNPRIIILINVLTRIEEGIKKLGKNDNPSKK